MKLLCPAKINLTLEVLARQPDGYHAIRSVMVPLGIYDEIHVEEARDFSFACSEAALENDDNLVVRAARAVAPDARLRIRLEKRIPSQAGLGGGSSDAAAVLRAAMAGAFRVAPFFDWIGTARSLGSDVPFFLAGTAALVENTGERVTAAGALPAWHVLIVTPPAQMSTAAAYAALDARPLRSRPRNASSSLAALTALQRGDFERVQALLNNDFQETIAAAAPPVARALDALRAAGATNALLCGSGSAVFTLAPDASTIAGLAHRLSLPEEYRRFEAPFARTPNWRGGTA